MRQIDIEADDLWQARAKLASMIQTGEILIAEKIIDAVQKTTTTTTGETEISTVSWAKYKLPSGAEILDLHIRQSPEQRIEIVDADDGEIARSIVKARLSKNEFIKKVRLCRIGRRGFLGIGRIPYSYSVEIAQKVFVELTWVARAKITAKVGASELIDMINSTEMDRSIGLLLEQERSSQGYDHDLESLKSNADYAMNNGQWFEALGYWRTITVAQPKQASSWSICGFLLLQKDQEHIFSDFYSTIPPFEIDVRTIVTVEFLKPYIENVKQQSKRESRYFDLRLAVKYLDHALSLDSKLESAWYIKACCLCRIGIEASDAVALKMGLDCFETALQLNGSRSKSDFMADWLRSKATVWLRANDENTFNQILRESSHRILSLERESLSDSCFRSQMQCKKAKFKNEFEKMVWG